MLAAFLLFPSAYTASAQDIDTSSTGTGWITDPELIPRGPLLARTSDVKSTSGENLALQDELLTYEDRRFDFSISYPSSWQVNPREDDTPTNTEVLSFTGPERSGFTPSIYIGHYLIDIKDDISL